MSANDFLGTMAILAGIIVAVCFLLPVLTGLFSKKVLQADDKLPELCLTGTIISLSRQTSGVFVTEEIILEAADGTRKRLKNVQTQNIILHEGDFGKFTVRGKTIYSFQKLPTTATGG